MRVTDTQSLLSLTHPDHEGTPRLNSHLVVCTRLTVITSLCKNQKKRKKTSRAHSALQACLTIHECLFATGPEMDCSSNIFLFSLNQHCASLRPTGQLRLQFPPQRLCSPRSGWNPSPLCILPLPLIFHPFFRPSLVSQALFQLEFSWVTSSRIGPTTGREGVFLHRPIRWNESGFSCRPDPKHMDALIATLSLEDVRPVATPFTRDTGKGQANTLSELSVTEKVKR